MKKYRHYKGDIYSVIGSAILEKTREPMIVYRRYDGDSTWFLRPYNEFHGVVTVGGETMNRFEEIAE
jgi:hypothetical protein